MMENNNIYEALPSQPITYSDCREKKTVTKKRKPARNVVMLPSFVPNVEIEGGTEREREWDKGEREREHTLSPHLSSPFSSSLLFLFILFIPIISFL